MTNNVNSLSKAEFCHRHRICYIHGKPDGPHGCDLCIQAAEEARVRDFRAGMKQFFPGVCICVAPPGDWEGMWEDCPVHSKGLL